MSATLVDSYGPSLRWSMDDYNTQLRKPNDVFIKPSKPEEFSLRLSNLAKSNIQEPNVQKPTVHSLPSSHADNGLLTMKFFDVFNKVAGFVIYRSGYNSRNVVMVVMVVIAIIVVNAVILIEV
ncbi:hypothetical protein F8M41_002936 [Gigaspora margarita]|uniref:Uncharacterized protein n=1 Tax=Gigaspora margarita TaxID=4874 RepID=A0A8H3XF40_GIGMA|nr:hypothetical protein F8M41_002936 [Gigaspora margarita]